MNVPNLTARAHELIAPGPSLNLAINAHRLRLSLLDDQGAVLSTSPVLDTTGDPDRIPHIEAGLLDFGDGPSRVPMLALNRTPPGMSVAVLNAAHGVALEVWQRVGRADLLAYQQQSAHDLGGLPVPKECAEHDPGSALCPHESLVCAVKFPRLHSWSVQDSPRPRLSLRARLDFNPHPDLRLGLRPGDFRDTRVSLGITSEWPDAAPVEMWARWSAA